jgi:hypothetical protein
MIEYLKCQVCGGNLSFNMVDTVESYTDPDAYNVDDINDYAQQMTQEYTSFKCLGCNTNVRLTIREMEKMVRDAAIKMAVSLVSRETILGNDGLHPKRKVMVYCGKCNGFDGMGSCFIDTFEECNLKRFPHVN